MKRTFTIANIFVLFLVSWLSHRASSQDARTGLFPINPNNMNRVFDPSSDPPSGIDFGDFPDADLTPGIGLTFRAEASAIVDTFYDTGAITTANRFLPSTIALDGSTAARGRGRFDMTATGSQLRFGIGTTDLPSQPTAVAEVDFDGAELRLRHVFGKIQTANGAAITGGQTDSTFADAWARPASIINDGTPTGAVFIRRAQLRYTVFGCHGFSYSVAIEDPTDADFVLVTPATDVRLQRYPDFAARIRWDADVISSAQLAVLVRGIGFEDVTGEEHFTTGWGIAATTRLLTSPNELKHNIQLGGVAGQGLGRYLWGFGANGLEKPGGDVTAALPNADGGLDAVSTAGGFIGYQYFWSRFAVTNVAYGYALADTSEAPAPAPGTSPVGRESQNAWVNLILEIKPGFNVGFEYQYGIFEIYNGTDGDNHRVQMTLSYAAPK